MKKFKAALSLILIALMLGSLTVCFAATEEKPYAYVNVYDGKDLVLSMYKVQKTDEDGDGSWTINDALLSAHKAKCKDGFASVKSDWGLSIVKLWNDESGSFGYYKNNAMVMTDLTEKLSETSHDVVYAFVYSDKQGFSDAYSFFDESVFEGDQGDKKTLTLNYVAFDENFNPQNVPLAGATVYFDAKKTEFKTDENGKVEIELPAHSTIISAKKDGMTLIPPVTRFNRTEMTGSPALIIVIIVSVVLIAVVTCVMIFTNKKRKAG